jgi:carbon monoxide dehydrogenase subunit G
MLIENEFQVPATIDRAWAYLLDVEEIAPCAPGAELTEVVDDHTWKGKINLKLGPISLSFAGTVTVAERDEANHRVVLKAQGQEQKGKGAANATITSWLEPAGPNGATRVKMQADIMLTGTVAQVSRGLLPDVSARLTNQFADCLRDHLTASQGAATAESSTTPQPSEAIGGIRLGLYAIVRAIGRFFRRLFGRASS